MVMGIDLLLALGVYWLIKNKKSKKNFRRNGGLLLQQQLASNDGVIEKTRIFTAKELKNATDHFKEDNIIGQGGHGTVFSGILTDGRVVAVKRSKKVDDRQLGQFINEVVILSQINHRNVVKLLGCCLETEVPILVCEFIPNGSLDQHIHNPEGKHNISWKMRLQIAAESAGAIAYLHSSSSTPIYHRDVKSSNILLDEKYNAKVSDFGISRAVVIDQTHMTTQVQGTFGYLDPEYYNSSQYTQKSDVYSFGVVLVELLTGKKPVFVDKSNEKRSLATVFRSEMQRSRLLDILDAQVLLEAENREILTVAELAKECLNLDGINRPTMKEVAMVLEGLRSRHGTSSKQHTSLELDHMPDHISEVDSGDGPFISSTFSVHYGNSDSVNV